MKKGLCIAVMIAGIAMMICGFALNIDGLWNGILSGVGSALFGGGFALLYILIWRTRHPSEYRQAEIESKDERTVAIRTRAKAVSGDIFMWLVMAAAWITIVADTELWVTLTLIGIFVAKTVIEFVLMAKFNKEM